MNNSRNISSCLFHPLSRSLFVLAGCAVASFASAANPDYQIYDESLDGRFGFRDSFAGAAKAEESDTDAVSAIEVVEISSKRVVLPSPKEALTPIHLQAATPGLVKGLEACRPEFSNRATDVDNGALRMGWK